METGDTTWHEWILSGLYSIVKYIMKATIHWTISGSHQKNPARIQQEKCPKSKPRAKSGKQAVKVLSRVCAGLRRAARDVYSYGKDKHQTISKCG